MTEPRRNVVLREVPHSIYVALAIVTAGTIVHLLGVVATPDGSLRGMAAFNRTIGWFLVDQACWITYMVALQLGALELARRQTGNARTLAMIAAGFGFAPLAFYVARTILPMIYQDEHVFELQRVVGATSGLFALASATLLTIAADAWRRVPVAAAGLILVYLATGTMPVIGELLTGWIGTSPIRALGYALVRELGLAAAYIFVAGALAARGRLVPEARRAVSGLSLARLAVVLRIFGGLLLVFVLIAALESEGAGKLFFFGGPLFVIATTVLFTIGMLRVAGSDLSGMPQLRIAIGTLLALWSTVIQLFQLAQIRDMLREGVDVPGHLRVISIVGPLLGALGIALVASAIVGLARVRANSQLASSLAVRTIGLLVIMLVGLALQHYAVDTSSDTKAVAMLIGGSLAGMVSLVLLFGILRDGMTLVDTPELPPARVV